MTPVVRRWRYVAFNAAYAFVAAFAVFGSVSTAVIAVVGGTVVAVLIGLIVAAMLSAALAALAGFGAYRLRLEEERQRTGCCPRCGYDLRESVDRCPECGVRFRRRARAARTEG